MPILSRETILEKISSREIVLRPFREDHVQPASVDLCISDDFLQVDDSQQSVIDFSTEIQYKSVHAQEIILPPKSFILAKTLEYLEVPLDLTAFVEGRSSIGRLGLFIQNAGWIDSGFKGTITLELFNANSVPIRLQAGKRVCQLVFMTLDRKLKQGYSGKYQGQLDVTGSRINHEK
ncbi:MAG: dCTP deaminase [Candidatus Diapherotrites archaeon]|nr:dCTP deaminase [Candidatus Diapherotrites archaeon]